MRSYDRNLAVNVWWDFHRNKEIDLDRCPTEADPLLTLDKVNFMSFGGLEGSVGIIKLVLLCSCYCFKIIVHQSIKLTGAI